MTNRIIEFSNEITTVCPESTELLPSLADQVRHDGKYNRIEHNTQSNFIIFDENNFINPVNYEHFSLRAVGREISRHQVHFGSLAIQGNGLNDKIDIAVKDSHMSLALGEVAMMQYFAKLGLPTFSILGIVASTRNHPVLKEQLTHILTRYNQEVVTMDTLDWLNMTTPELQTQLALAAIALGVVNGNGIVHGDSKLKNFGQLDDGNTFLVDLEHASSFKDLAKITEDTYFFTHQEQELAMNRIERLVRCDLRDLSDSIAPYLYQKGKNKSAIFKVINRLVLEPYKSGLTGTPQETCCLKSLDAAYSIFKRESKE